MQRRGVHLEYGFRSEGQRGGDIHNPLFVVLSALHENGSIQQAARALGVSYRHLWGSLKQWEVTLGEPLVAWVQGQAARLTPFGERLLWAEQRARARMTPHIEALRSELERVLAEALDGSQQVLRIDASHDLALPLLRDRASSEHRLHIDLRFAGSLDALHALAEGRCTVAGFHVPALDEAGHVFARRLKPLLTPGRHKLIGCMQRQQGLMVAPGNPLQLSGLADLVGRGLRFVHRQPGSATALLTDHLLLQAGLPADALGRPEALGAEDSHLAVAATIASGVAEAGIGIEAAAARYGLGFVPLCTEHYFLVCLADVLESPPVQALRSALRRPAWADTLAALPGYAPWHAGEVLSLTKALPWWRFRTPKARPAAEAAAAG